jgi:hypothetical protein
MDNCAADSADTRLKVVGAGVVTHIRGRQVQGMVTASAGKSMAELQFQFADLCPRSAWAALAADGPVVRDRLVMIDYRGIVHKCGSVMIKATETQTIVRGIDSHHSIEITLPRTESVGALGSIADVVCEDIDVLKSSAIYSWGAKARRVSQFDWRACAEPDGTDAFVASTCHVAVPRTDAAVEAIASVGLRAKLWSVGVRLAHVNRAPAAAWAALARGDPGSIETIDPCASDVIADRATSLRHSAGKGRSKNTDPGEYGSSRTRVASDGAAVTFSVTTPSFVATVRAPLGVCAPAFAEIARVVAGLESEVAANTAFAGAAVTGPESEVAANTASACAAVVTKKGGAGGGRPPGRWGRLAAWRPAWW